uniref:Cembrene A synthase n=1 Tax=Eleutherobia rubra TaxID=2508183 RepID=UPI00202BBB11|nr:Chain A, Cembrene A synthase [Eleutherobia rubra]
MSGKIVRAPSNWTTPHKKMLKEDEDQELIAFDKLLSWVSETGVGTEEQAKIVFKKINAYFYLRCLYPVLPRDPKSMKIFQLNLHFLILGYIIDDAIEKYNENEMKELIAGYNLLQSQVSETFPNFPSIFEMKQLLGNMKNDFSKSAITTMFDYVNKTTLILLEEGEIAEHNVLNYRKRLSNAVAVYFDALLSKTKTGCEISDGAMLWRRCFDALAIAVYMLTEVFSKTLVKNHTLPVSEFYKFYLLSILFCVVINDLHSYERDKLDDTDSVVKVWFKEGSVANMEAATSKVSKILDAIIQQMYLFVEEGKARHPELSEWFERIAYMTVGWIYIHKTVVPRYVSSPFQIEVVEIHENMISNWLLKKDAYGQRVVQQFLKNLNDPQKKNIMLYDE